MPNIDVASQFKNKLIKIGKDSNDFNILCNAIYYKYLFHKNVIKGLTIPLGTMKKIIEKSVKLIDDGLYKDIIKNLNKLNAAYNDIFPNDLKPATTITLDLAKVGSVLQQTCLDYLSSIPESMFNLLSGVNEISNSISDTIDLPKDMVFQIFKDLEKIKEDVLSQAIGPMYETLLYPFIKYEKFIKSCGFIEDINAMRRIENCMLKPGICNRDPKDFIEPKTKKTYSRYYQEMFMLDNRGRLKAGLIPSLKGNKSKIAKIQNIFDSLRAFRTVVK